MRDTSSYPSCTPAKRFAYHIKGKFGLTVEQYDKLFEDAGNACEICSRPVEKAGQGNIKGSLGTGCVDHCHKTGAIRGILCRVCNSWLGVVNDEPSKATAYLSRRS